jgi:hypothetical protein
LRGPGGNLLLDRDVRTAGLNGYVKPLILIKTFRYRGEKTTVLRLRIPVRLQHNFGQAIIRGTLMASGREKAQGSKGAQNGEGAFGHGNPSSAAHSVENITMQISKNGLILAMQKLNRRPPLAGLALW